MLPKIINKYKAHKKEYSSFSYSIDAAFDDTMKRSKVINIMLTECKLIIMRYYLGVQKYQMTNLPILTIKTPVL